MNRLWVRLSFAFGVVVLLGAVSLVVVSVVSARLGDQPDPFIASIRQPDGLLDVLQMYYRTHEGWNNVDILLAGAQVDRGPVDLQFSLQDTLHGVQYAAHPITATDLLATIPIMVDNQQVGALTVYRNQSADQHRPPGPQSFLIDRLRDSSLLVALISGTVGLLFGVLVSRTLTAPLEKLASAAQAISERKLQHRVEVTGTREIVAVATAFNNMAATLEEAETVRRNMLADIAHELRTPLSVLQGNLQALLDGVYRFEPSEVAHLYHQTELLNRLVNDLHELSLAEAHQLRLNRSLTDVGDLLNNVRNNFIPAADAAGVSLQVTATPDLPPVLLDPMRFTEILDNLISNALRHTPKDGTVTVHADVVQNAAQIMLRVIVKDSGEGISADHLPYVFDRFYRTNRGRSRSTGGAGLGLAIVRAIVEMHGGFVEVQSEGIPGKGSTFTVYLPVNSQAS